MQIFAFANIFKLNGKGFFGFAAVVQFRATATNMEKDTFMY